MLKVLLELWKLFFFCDAEGVVGAVEAVGASVGYVS
jgi:hypothetical protein